MARDGRMIDLWVFSREGRGHFRASRGAHGPPHDEIRDSEISSELSPSKTGFTKMPIRMIWSTAGYAASLNETWTSVGAKAVAGARAVNFFPHQFGRFASKWSKGSVSFRDALDRSW